MRLSPRDPAMAYWLAFAGYAQLELSQYQKAIDDLNEALARNPGQPRTMLTLIAARAMAGDMKDARRLLKELQVAQPHLTHAALQKMYNNSRVRNRVLSEGIRRILASQERTSLRPRNSDKPL